MAKARSTKNPLLTIFPSPLLHLISSSPFSSLLFSPRKSPRSHHCHQLCINHLTTLALFVLLWVLTLLAASVLIIFPPGSRDPVPCSRCIISPAPSRSTPRTLLASLSPSEVAHDQDGMMDKAVLVPLPAQGATGNASGVEREFWEQPDGGGYMPCLEFSLKYRKKSNVISKEKRRFLVVVASGGLNQQKNQIVDAVVIARILEAALVVPVLQINPIWGDESEFSDIFDVAHFKRILQADVRIVSSLPSTHLVSRQSIEHQIPHDISPLWIRTRFAKQLENEGLLVLKGLDSKLSKNLPPDLQKLKCKVAFHALRFAAPIQELGNRMAKRMWIEGPYIALHLRLEKDVWARSGCLTGLGPELDKAIAKARKSQPEYLTGRLNMTYTQRRLAGLCPLTALEIARLLKGLGATGQARIYVAGGEPFGGNQALQPVLAEFPNLVTKTMLASGEELSSYANKASAMAAIDFIVSLSSDVFVPSHGGNMAKIMQGQRAYVGHRKYIKPNKRALIPLLEDSNVSDSEFGSNVRIIHRKLQGQPEPRSNKRRQDVIAFPVPDCMCKHRTSVY